MIGPLLGGVLLGAALAALVMRALFTSRRFVAGFLETVATGCYDAGKQECPACCQPFSPSWRLAREHRRLNER